MPTRQEMQWEHWRQNKVLRNARKETVRNREPDRVRRRDWMPGDPEDSESWDEVETPQFERVMPRGEQERRRANLKRAQVLNVEGGAPEAASAGASASSLSEVDRNGAQPGERSRAIPGEDAGGLVMSWPAGAGSRNGTAGQMEEGRNKSGPAAPRNGAGAPASPQGAGSPRPAANGRNASAPAAASNGAGQPPSLPLAGSPRPAVNGQHTPRGGPAVPAPTRPGLSKPGAAPAASGWLEMPGQASSQTRAVATVRDDARLSDVAGAGRSPFVEPLPPGYGLVLEAGSGVCRVDMGGEMLLCTLRGSLPAVETGLTNVLAAGDRVRVTPSEGGRGVVEAVLPRRTALARPDVYYGHLRQVLAANVDQLLAVAAYENPPVWPELIDRYLITAALNGLASLICLNKVDLAEDMAEARAAVAPYLALGYQVIFTSAQTGYGVNALRSALAGRATVLAGLSGVGKSSLLSAVQPGLKLRVTEVNERQRLGRHTTTGATLHKLTGGGFVVDTPGIKEWGLSGLGRRDLGGYYPEIASLAGSCRFDDCTHLEEPGCAVKAAVRSGRMAHVRYDNYRKIYASLKE